MSGDAPKTIAIRKATAFDAVNILRLAELGLKENTVAYPPLDPLLGLRWCLDTIEHGVVFVADLSGRLVGTIGLERASYPWSAEPHARDSWFYVHHGFRSYGTADNLVLAAEKACDERGLKLTIYFGGGVQADLKDRWLRKRGYTYGGGMHVRLPAGISSDKPAGE